MITSGERLRIEYELARTARYGNIRQNVFYTADELLAAYEAWSRSTSGYRSPEWDNWCDHRDAVPRGTNSRISKERRLTH